ncbi:MULTISPECIES: nitronate monooxygenase [Methylobacterium]|uniref:Propionate 3-nitronate monooxygenase n=1 Tax=Methylobacterium jeotgali TaxID=381630 RepID=A0ABQ4T0Q0_9HYPH|nr:MULTISPECIES: nitronate monooxygenase [Methylobacterium]PIU06166.1 MAG: nitronate monooxygenase [Methylobacterium sp. CG09_land_8_20_14_0_10_71_15]PIU12035.1 MAG: nitronate monooxygenase [Methylobacterium sp. CG08_land_8_20_14_0_20_71_15]GBU20121.1 2-nitropropane dioxygenase [Methylobacterium sp.]GJE07803.1 Nitronate monooxygenase [Methylobacterium jeotgali]
MSATARFLDRFGLAHPIVQAPMAGVSTPELAAAVSNAGGLGSIGLGASPPASARGMIEATRALTDRPFNVNVFCHPPALRDAGREAAWLAHLAPLFAELGAPPPESLREIYRSHLDGDESHRMLLETRPPVVSFHFGLPDASRLAALREAGIRTMATATNPEEAARIEAAGIDAIVAQGIEAGGHRGVFDTDAHDTGLGTGVLVALLVRQTALPVIAAGGIMDGRGIRAALDLGAAGAQLGTAFILCPESAADAAYRAALASARAFDTRLTSAISGRPARGLANRLILHGAAPGAPPACAYPVAYDAGKHLHAAASARGSDAAAAHWAGQGAPMARTLPAADLFARLVEECAA